MASEILAVPEEHLADVIRVIRAGLKQYPFRRSGGNINPEVREQLNKWCDEEEEYLNRLEND